MDGRKKGFRDAVRVLNNTARLTFLRNIWYTPFWVLIKGGIAMRGIKTGVLTVFVIVYIIAPQAALRAAVAQGTQAVTAAYTVIGVRPYDSAERPNGIFERQGFSGECLPSLNTLPLIEKNPVKEIEENFRAQKAARESS